MKRDFRDAVFAVVHDLMRADPNVVVLTNDNGAWGLDTIREQFPARVVNVGVAEQNMMSLAGGLASSGKRVFVYGQIAHLMRAWEQIKVGICIPNLPVTILGLGAGLSMWRDGPTHYGIEDVGMMRTLPCMTIYNPADWVCAEACVKMAYEARTPHYIRLDKYNLSPLYEPTYDFSQGYCVFGDDTKNVRFTTGVETQRARRSNAPCVIDVFRLNPPPLPLSDYFKELYDSDVEIVIRDEHGRGGLVSILGEEFLIDHDDGPILHNDHEWDAQERESLPDKEPAWVDDGYGIPFGGG